MAACIRGPRTQGSSENLHHSKSSTAAASVNSHHKSIVQIYTDWGNHYLEKARSKKLIQDLQTDLTDGVLLADLIEAVINQKVPDVQRKPKTASQMVDNVRACLRAVERLGISLEGVSAKEIREGSLKSILALFFALSKHKQQLKLQAEASRIKKHDDMLSRLPTPYQSPLGHGHHQTSIPTPLSLRHNQAGTSPLKCQSANSSRSTSPSHSFIPTPRSGAAAAGTRISLNEKQLAQSQQRGGAASRNASATSNSSTGPASPYGASCNNKNNSMLDKLKLFNPKDKPKPGVGSAKRTSSSSGFSSARSERSDSSASLCSDLKPRLSASNTSGGDKKEGSQNDLNRTSGGGRKKIVKVETKLVRPTRGSTASSRPSSAGSTQQSQGDSPPQAHLAKGNSAPSGGQTHNSLAQPSVNGVTNRAEDKPSTFELITDHHNPPPPPAPSSNAMESDVSEPLRVAGGGTSIPKVTNTSSTITPTSQGVGGGGIPKPTAVVKGYPKPTHTVAPMPPVQHNNLRNEPIYASLEKQKLQSVLETSHERQNSIEEVEEAMSNLKPMQPLLPGYNKRTIAISPRTVPLNRNRGYRPLDTYPRSNTERNFLETEYSSASSASGYLSDGEVLQSKCNDIPDGYMSEGGASLYQRIQDKRGIKSGLSDFTKSHQDSSRSKHDLRVNSKDCEGAADEAGLVDLSGTDATHHKRRVLNGSGGSSGCVGPVGRSGEGLLPLSTAAGHQPHPVVYRVVGSRHVKKADSGQQTDNSAFRQVSSNQWKGSGGGLCRGDSRGEIDARCREKRSQSVANGVQRKQEKRRTAGSKEELNIDYCNGDRPAVSSKGSGGSSSSSGGSSSGGSKGSSKARGVPPTFGYVKRASNGSTKDNGTVQSQPVSRTKVKVSGGTQTEVQYSATAQLSAGVRERLMMSPKTTTVRQHPADTGSLSDSNYAEIPQASPYGSWLRHSGAYTASLPTRTSAAGGSMIEAESIESLPAQLHHRASLTHARLMGSAATAPRLSRSNSISYLRDRTFPRSTKSEKLYPSMFQRSEEVEPYYSIPYNIGVGPQHHHSSQPTSPTPSQVSHGTPSRFNYPISPISSSPSSHGINRNSPYVGIITKMNSKDDDVHGSAVSLVSTTSSLYSTPEEKQAHEVRKLRKELSDAQEKVHSLTNQLSTNAHVVSAFEQSLSNMTQRLQQLTTTAEKKDSELLELRQTIELLRKQSVEAGLTSQNLSPSLARRHTINTTDPANESNIARQLSTDSVSSLNSLSSACSLSSTPVTHEQEKKKKRGWLRSSFNKAFSRTKKNRTGSISSGEADDQRFERASAPSSPLLGGAPGGHQHHHNDSGGGPLDGGGGICGDSPTSGGPRIIGTTGSANGSEGDGDVGPELVEQLRRQLREKDLVLTDIRLEALSSAHQLESLKDTVIKMRNEMVNLKQDNERLQRLVTSKSLTSSQSSLPRNDSLERRFSMNDAIPDCKYDLFSGDPDGKRVTLSVYLGCHGSYHRYVEDGIECPIASLSISGKTKWDMLDAMIRRAFKDYIERIDPCGGGLGLGVDSIWSYHVGEVVRYKDGKLPELLPCGYLVGDTCEITLCLKGALHSGSLDALVFDTLVPKSILQRYVSLLTEYRRIILCGSSGTGKSYLANKLAEFLAIRAGKESTAESVATFNVEHKSSKELRQYLANIAEQCETNASDLPSVIILDNLHQASSLGEVFNGFLNARYSKCPYIIGTMNQATCSTTNLQLHHNFRWILCANHMEPVKGFLTRYLKRRLLENEAKAGCRNPELARITDWIPRAWQHLNQFLEAHSSSDVTIGPRLFVSCPMDVDGSQVWFTDLWNYSVVPYLLEAVREGLQVYGRRAAWEDPTQYICHTYPWAGEAVHGGPDTLIRLRPEDVGYEVQTNNSTVGSIKSMSSTQSEVEGDPLLNMLMRLQEAANYTSPHGNDSDSNTNEALNGLGVQSTL
ncbi:sickie isoform X3 [Rhodnius prolixus]|uniref:sickie isoform X3 n=2 Tax=Rhodnius prolixus TaxID=13249 RepID=UPI003D187AD6